MFETSGPNALRVAGCEERRGLKKKKNVRSSLELETPQVNEIQSFVVREKSDGTDNDFFISSVSEKA